MLCAMNDGCRSVTWQVMLWWACRFLSLLITRRMNLDAGIANVPNSDCRKVLPGAIQLRGGSFAAHGLLIYHIEYIKLILIILFINIY